MRSVHHVALALALAFGVATLVIARSISQHFDTSAADARRREQAAAEATREANAVAEDVVGAMRVTWKPAHESAAIRARVNDCFRDRKGYPAMTACLVGLRHEADEVALALPLVPEQRRECGANVERVARELVDVTPSRIAEFQKWVTEIEPPLRRAMGQGTLSAACQKGGALCDGEPKHMEVPDKGSLSRLEQLSCTKALFASEIQGNVMWPNKVAARLGLGGSPPRPTERLIVVATSKQIVP